MMNAGTSLPEPIASRVEVAKAYLARGWMPLPVPTGSKNPARPNWQTNVVTPETVAAQFAGEGNIGILLGEPSNGLVDVDLDCPEAVELADSFLPHTDVVTGRTNRPGTHRWFIATGANTTQFKDPVTRAMLVELRSTGGQTLVGPSIHPDDHDQYDMLVGDPAVVDAAELTAAVAALAHAIEMLRYPDGVPTRPKPTGPADHRPLTRSRDDDATVLKRAAAYLDNIPGAVSGSGGHDQTYAAATAMVHGFGLDPEVAFTLMMDRYNPRCDPPWSEGEIRHKVEDAATKPHDKPFGWLRDAPGPSGATIATVDSGASAPEAAVGDRDMDTIGTRPDDDPVNGILGQRDPATGKLVLSPKRTLPTAQAYLREFAHHPDGRTIHAYCDMFLEWEDNRYRMTEEAAIRNRLQPWLHGASRFVPVGQTGKFKLVPFDSNPATVSQAVDTIRSLVHLPGNTPSPSWLDGGVGRPPAIEILPCRTHNLHIPTRTVLPATPALFTMNALDFDYHPDPPPPEQWIKFMEQTFGDDLEAMELLQEWMGYSLTADTSQQKMLLIVGPRRSGKGTIGRILTKLVGSANVAGPSTDSLGSGFGLQPLIGKSLAIVSDARFGGTNLSAVVEALLCISGEDRVSVPRKFMDALHVKLPTRFMFLANEVPRLTDASNALAGRFLVLRLTESFYGREDHQLTQKLEEELPGILNWALEGYRRLRHRGWFQQPKSAKDHIDLMEDLGSPVGAFVRDKCEVKVGLRVQLDELYPAWTSWCEEEGRTTVPSRPAFGRDLLAAVPGLKCRRGSGNVRFYDGIGLRGVGQG